MRKPFASQPLDGAVPERDGRPPRTARSRSSTRQRRLRPPTQQPPRRDAGAGQRDHGRDRRRRRLAAHSAVISASASSSSSRGSSRLPPLTASSSAASRTTARASSASLKRRACSHSFLRRERRADAQLLLHVLDDPPESSTSSARRTLRTWLAKLAEVRARRRASRCRRCVADHGRRVPPAPGVGHVPRLDVQLRGHQQVDVLSLGGSPRPCTASFSTSSARSPISSPASSTSRRATGSGQLMPCSANRLTTQRHGVLVVGRVEDADVADRGDGPRQRPSAIPPAAEQGQAGAGRGIVQVGDDRRDLVGLERLGVAHQHQPLAAQQVERVARGDNVALLLLADHELLDRVLVELAAQARAAASTLGQSLPAIRYAGLCSTLSLAAEGSTGRRGRATAAPDRRR